MATPAITQRYALLKNKGVDLGAAQGVEQDAKYGGRFQAYERGRIYWHPSTGAHALQGRMLQRYIQAGGQDVNPATGEREMGFPTSEAMPTEDGMYACATFEWGIICDVPGTALVRLFGALYTAWKAEGGALGRLGHPIDDVARLQGGRAAWFERGVLWHPEGQNGMLVGELLAPTLGNPAMVDPANPGTFQWMKFDGVLLSLDANPALGPALMQNRLALIAAGPGTVLNLVPGQLTQQNGQRWMSFRMGTITGGQGGMLIARAAPPPDLLAGSVLAGGIQPETATLVRRQLYSLAFRTPGLGPKIISPHCLYARNDWENFFLAHVTDVHASRRIEYFRSTLRRAGVSEEDISRLNHYNDNFRRFIRYANHLHDAGLLDVIILTGDLVDYVHEADDNMNGPGNFRFFESLVMGFAPSLDNSGAPNEELRVPIFTSLGNHDYRTLPYALGFKVKVTSEDVGDSIVGGILGSIPVIGDTLASAFDSATSLVGQLPGVGLITSADPIRILASFQDATWTYQPHNLIEPEALKLMGLKIGNSYGLPSVPPEVASRSVTVDKRMFNGTSYYFRHINRSRSYVVALGAHRIVMLDTRWDNGIVDSLGELVQTELGFGTESMENFLAANPDSVGVLDSELALVRTALEGAGPNGIVVVGMHAQPINPPNNRLHNFMRETAHPSTDAAQVLGFLNRNDASMHTPPSAAAPYGVPASNLDSRHPGWTRTGTAYMHKGTIDDLLDSGIAVGNKEALPQLFAGKGVSRPVNLVLCGHGHYRMEFRFRWDADRQQLEQYTDHYLGNPESYYATTYSDREWWNPTKQQRLLVHVKDGAPPAGAIAHITDSRPTIWPDLSTLTVAPYPAPLSSAPDPKQWWQFHSPVVVQTGAVGPCMNNRAALATNSVVPDPDFTGFRVLQVTNNTIARSYYVLTAEMAGAFPLAWEKAAGGSGGLAGGKADALHGAHVATSRPQR